jgi:hypothetical protein
VQDGKGGGMEFLALFLAHLHHVRNSGDKEFWNQGLTKKLKMKSWIDIFSQQA